MFWYGAGIVTFGLVLKSGQRLAPSKCLQGLETVPSREDSIIGTSSVSDQQQQQQHHSRASTAQIATVKSVFDVPAVELWASRRGLREHHLKSLYKGVFQSRDEEDFQEFVLQQSDIPKVHRSNLLDTFRLLTCSFSDIQESSRSTVCTQKMLVKVSSGREVETVLIRHSDGRCTVCVSSQVGCARSCSFCATGTMGLQQNLPACDILQQVWIARGQLENPSLLRNVVFMGMGEPLDNYDAVYDACRGLTHQRLFGLKCQRVTISTVGALPSMICRLADEAPTISLAVSLHSAVSAVRDKLIPSARDLRELSAALQYHYSRTGKQIMLEYLLIEDVNDSKEALRALIAFAVGGSYYVNLIPYNPTVAGEKLGYKTPSDSAIVTFHNALIEGGVHSRVRWSTAAGRGATGACGQLVIKETL